MTFADAVYAVWAAAAVAVVLLWGLSRTGGRWAGRVGRPSALLSWALARPAARLAAVLAWAWVGVHFFAR